MAIQRESIDMTRCDLRASTNSKLWIISRHSTLICSSSKEVPERHQSKCFSTIWQSIYSTCSNQWLQTSYCRLPLDANIFDSIDIPVETINMWKWHNESAITRLWRNAGSSKPTRTGRQESNVEPMSIVSCVVEILLE